MVGCLCWCARSVASRRFASKQMLLTRRLSNLDACRSGRTQGCGGQAIALIREVHEITWSGEFRFSTITSGRLAIALHATGMTATFKNATDRLQICNRHLGCKPSADFLV